MARNRLRTLIAVNAVLGAALAAVVFSPPVSAQRGASRARGDYTMVAGAVQGREEAAIYIVDVNNQELVAVSWDRNEETLRPLGFRSLAQDAQRQGGGR